MPICTMSSKLIKVWNPCPMSICTMVSNLINVFFFHFF